MATTKRRKRSKNIVIDMTAEEFGPELAEGVRPGKHVFRRGGFFERHRVTPEQMKEIIKDPRNTKLIITLRIDSDIVGFFKQRAEKPGAPGYQTQMNDALRAFMERDASPDFSKLLENET